MSDYLVIVESPAKASTIKKYLGKNYQVLASMGHIRDLPKSSFGVDVEQNYEPRYITIRGKGDVLQALKKNAKNAKKVFLATDPDREGEAISWHLAEYLGIDSSDQCRITFNEITKTAVKNAIKEPRPIDMDKVDAQVARRILDRIVGYKISPLLWEKVKRGLSAGRVQSVATRIIVDRQNAIDAFAPVEYFTITAQLEHKKKKYIAEFFGDSNGKIELRSKEGMKGESDVRLADVRKVLAAIKGAKFVVTKTKVGEKTRSAPTPYTTSTLQQDASNKLSFDTRRTMAIAQQLYEGVNVTGVGAVGLITYMRTDSLRISDDAFSAARDYITTEIGGNYAIAEKREYKAKKNTQDAHEAIRPTDVAITPDRAKASLSPEQYKLYKMIWERFVASQMQNAIYDTVSMDITANGYIFRATGSAIKFDGFLKVYADPKKKKDDMPEALPEGTELKLLDIAEKQHFTEPPPQYTEATLIKTLEEEGIGRPSTYAPIITTIISRGYVTKSKGKILTPTELGKIVTDLMVRFFAEYVDVHFTANLEEQLDCIEDGTDTWRHIVDEFYKPFHEVLSKAQVEMAEITIKDEVSDVECDKCGRLMVYKMSKYGKFLACPGYPECRNAKPILKFIDTPCPICGARVVERKTKKSRLYYVCENHTEEGGCPLMTWDMPSGKLCEKCKSPMVVYKAKGKETQRCSNKECGKKS